MHTAASGSVTDVLDTTREPQEPSQPVARKSRLDSIWTVVCLCVMMVSLCCAGTHVSTYLWARGPNDDVVQLEYLLLNSANMPAASYPVDAYVNTRVMLISTFQHFTLGGIAVNFTGNYYPALRITGMTAGQIVSLDDIEVSEDGH